MINKIKSALKLLLVMAILGISPALAQEFSATIRGKSATTVSKPTISLSDIADIQAKESEAQLSLAKISVHSGLLPGQTTELSAQKILEILKSNGVDLNKVGYIFHPSVSIKRASRSPSEYEARAVIESLVAAESLDLKVTNIQIPKDAQIFTGPSYVTASLRSKNSNNRTYALEFTNSDSERISVEVKAEMDSWRQVPVANRSLSAGSIIEALDFGLARVNTKNLPRDVALNADELIGKKIQRSIGEGEPFKMPSLDVVPVIKSGSRVTLVFNSAGLEATARGVASQDGQLGDLIEVKNDSSKNIVVGKVKDRTTVEVIE